ncbi:MAG: hypothetical protein F4Z04_17300 [Acidobacteria bacterium]|nr:hypothetical protein [Acidobacteriota bacterium]
MIRQNPPAELLGYGRPVDDVHTKGQIRVREGGSQSYRAAHTHGVIRHQRKIEIGRFPRIPTYSRSEGVYLKVRHVLTQDSPNRLQIRGSDVNRNRQGIRSSAEADPEGIRGIAVASSSGGRSNLMTGWAFARAAISETPG